MSPVEVSASSGSCSDHDGEWCNASEEGECSGRKESAFQRKRTPVFCQLSWFRSHDCTGTKGVSLPFTLYSRLMFPTSGDQPLIPNLGGMVTFFQWANGANLSLRPGGEVKCSRALLGYGQAVKAPI